MTREEAKQKICEILRKYTKPNQKEGYEFSSTIAEIILKAILESEDGYKIQPSEWVS